jgi:hypothetical protein
MIDWEELEQEFPELKRNPKVDYAGKILATIEYIDGVSHTLIRFETDTNQSDALDIFKYMVQQDVPEDQKPIDIRNERTKVIKS